jgi:nicotinate-nucleotide pyrophosphorylase (carboxylating)
VHARKQDGAPIERGETLLEIEGERADLLLYERVGLNILQRMSGIATMTHNLQERIRAANSETFVVGTRKTPWGLLDKRALHLGGGGTHRLGLWDAILVKNNHLALLASREEDAVCIAAQRAWACRGAAAFIEIEVRSLESAVAAAQTFRTLRDPNRQPDREAVGESYGQPGGQPDREPQQPQRRDASPSDATSDATNNSPSCPCVLMLDNIPPTEVDRILRALRAQGLLDYVLVEASGNISENNLEAYAACGVDAVSVGALTHSVQALDLSQRLS